MPLHHNVSGTWKDSTVWHNVSGTWKKCSVWHNVAGVWKQITALLAVAISNKSVSHLGFGIGSSVVYEIRNDGIAYTKSGGSFYVPIGGEWLTSGAVGDVEVRATKTSGTSPTGASLGVWLSCSTTRTWTLTAPSTGYVTCTLTVELRAASSGTVLDTATITLTADDTP